MICPACKNPLHEKSAGAMTVDICSTGCGGIWFDANELKLVSAPAALTLQSLGNVPVRDVKLTDARLCPRCPEQGLERKWFSESKQVEIDECPNCHGIWLDAGEFSRIYEESQRAKENSPLWRAALDVIAALEDKGSARRRSPHV